MITLLYTKDGVPGAGKVVKWEAAAGELKNAVSTTSPAGTATASLVSSAVGSTVVKGTVNGITGESETINFVVKTTLEGGAELIPEPTDDEPE